jgi:AAA15 family ATPase/GTPase
MAILHNLSIKNFRGIKEFNHEFYSKELICFIGRGDSGKSTILDAISLILSPNWNVTFYDTDFYDCNIEESIEIEVTLINLPVFFFKEPYALHLRGYNVDTGTIEDEITDEHVAALTIQLFVDKDLEPSWTIFDGRNEPIKISASARSKLNAFLISDYTDSHFSWSKGRPLNSILKQEKTEGQEEEKNIIIEALRDAKTKIDDNSFQDFEGVIKKVKRSAKNIGIDIPSTKTTLDFKDISIRDNRVCLHEGKIPFRLKGKGSKRLLSIAIQSIIADLGGIMLIDEIEQGLEPDRVKHLVRTFDRLNSGQIFLTTHSQNVIEELKSENLLLVSNNNGICKGTDCPEQLQNIVRACPEAMYAKRVIVCEGKTELGICRAMNEDRIKNDLSSFSELGIVCVLGEGDNFTKRAIELHGLKIDICVFCDSDVDAKLNPSKNDLKNNDIEIFDCEPENSIEQQFCNEIPWKGIQAMVKYAIKNVGIESVADSIEHKLSAKLVTDWLDSDTPELRDAIGKAAKSKEWFKRIDHGEFLGKIYFHYEEEIEDTELYSQLTDIHNWIEQ